MSRIFLRVAAAFAIGASALVAQTLEGTWKEVQAGCTARFAHSIVWADAVDRFVLFGGEVSGDAGFDLRNDVWTFSTKDEKWTEVKVSGPKPAVRAYHAAAWDTKRQRLWIFGGAGNGFASKADIWSFDPVKGVWDEAKVKGTAPCARLSAAMVYVEKSDQLLVYAGLKGFAENGGLKDVWSLDLGTMTWSERKSEKGPDRWQAAVALDKDRALLVVQGGLNGAMQECRDTWTYDLKTSEWTVADEGYGLADAHIAAYDPSAKRTLVFGGARFDRHEATDKFAAYDAAKDTWTAITTGEKKPSGRAYHAGAFSPSQKCLIVFGGTANQFNDPLKADGTWIFRWKK